MTTSAHASTPPDRGVSDHADRGHREGRDTAAVTDLSGRALANLRYIRSTMAQAQRLTTIPGLAFAAMGATAALAAVVASAWPVSTTAWLYAWLAEAVAAVGVLGVAMRRKARALGPPTSRGVGRRFLMGMLPPLVAGAVLTGALRASGAAHLVPGLWLLLYGAAVVSGGVLSVRLVPVMGAAFMAAGVTALLTPAPWPNTLLGLGFGGLHVVFGLLIWRRHGG